MCLAKAYNIGAPLHSSPPGFVETPDGMHGACLSRSGSSIFQTGEFLPIASAILAVHNGILVTDGDCQCNSRLGPKKQARVSINSPLAATLPRLSVDVLHPDDDRAVF